MTFVLSRYLDRVAHKPLPISPQGLAALQRAQLCAIPFENADPFLGTVPDLAANAVVAKLVERRRGGYCFELNGLFANALEAIGYTAQPVLGRVRMGAPSGGPRAHLAQIVTIDSAEYLADVGFGGPGPDCPLRLGTETPVQTALGRFRLRVDANTQETVLERDTPEGWFALYGFDHVPVTPPDVAAANFVCSKWEQAPFSTHLMLHRVLASGRVGLFNLQLTVGGQSRALVDEADFVRVLHQQFALDLEPGLTTRLWQRLSDAAVTGLRRAG